MSDNFGESIIRQIVSGLRGFFVFQSDDKGPRFTGGIKLDAGQNGYELPKPEPRKRTAKKVSRSTRRRKR